MPIEDDDKPRPTGVPGLPRPLDGLGIDELKAYRSVLQEEMHRIEVELERKQAIRGSASSLFKI